MAYLKKAEVKHLKEIANFLAEHKEFVDDLHSNLQDKHEARSDRYKESDKGVEESENVSTLEELQQAFEALHDKLNEMPLWEDA